MHKYITSFVMFLINIRERPMFSFVFSAGKYKIYLKLLKWMEARQNNRGQAALCCGRETDCSFTDCKQAPDT